MHRYSYQIICIVIFLFEIIFSISIVASERTDKYYFTHYTSGNSALPYNSVNEIVQDKKGFIWFGTSSGLSRFDGTRFRNYSKEDLGLKSAYVISLCTDNNGDLWVGTDLV
jgi:ligand-binding sensor domain-containing protein